MPRLSADSVESGNIAIKLYTLKIETIVSGQCAAPGYKIFCAGSEADMKKYNIVYADPPWQTRYFKEKKDGLLSRELPYSSMTDEEIMSLPVADTIADDAMLFLWVVDNRLPIIPELMRRWGFEYKCVGFVWAKKAKTTDGVNATFSSYTRRACEFCYIGTRGKYIVAKKSLDQFVFEPKQRHSKKPDTVRQTIVKMTGDLPRIELFARQPSEGWDVWGNEVESDIVL